MNYTGKQSKQSIEPTQNVAQTPTVSAFADQRASTAVQFKQQQIMRAAHSPNVIQQMTAEEEPIQGEFENEAPTQLQEAPAAKPNNTGLPDNLKSGIENLSGYSMDDVKVHFNSDKPAQLNAHAYAQGTDIHVAPGQEQHLPHEAWHVVQQKQGRVQPTMQMKVGVSVNDDAGLEHEADVMGAKAITTKPLVQHKTSRVDSEKNSLRSFPLQRISANTTIQLANAINAHNVTGNTSPVTQVIDFVSNQTGQGVDAVRTSMKNRLNGVNAIGSHIDELNTVSANVRADSIDVTIDNPTGGGARTSLITAIGKLGYFEGLLRGGGGDFDGGHLVALSHWNNWAHINTANNVVPQDRADNRYGTWRDEERSLSANASAQNPYRFTSTAAYPDNSYQISLATIVNTLMGPDIQPFLTQFNSANNLSINTRRPSAVTHALTTPGAWG